MEKNTNDIQKMLKLASQIEIIPNRLRKWGDLHLVDVETTAKFLGWSTTKVRKHFKTFKSTQFKGKSGKRRTHYMKEDVIQTYRHLSKN